MKKQKVIVLRITNALFDQLRAHRILTGRNTTEFITSSVNLALFADNQAASDQAVAADQPFTEDR